MRRPGRQTSLACDSKSDEQLKHHSRSTHTNFASAAHQPADADEENQKTSSPEPHLPVTQSRTDLLK